MPAAHRKQSVSGNGNKTSWSLQHTHMFECAGRPHHVNIKRNKVTKSAPKQNAQPKFLTCRTHSCALAPAYQHQAQQSHFNLSHWFWALSQGVRTFYSTHVCVCIDRPSSQVLATALTVSGQETSRLSQACPADNSSTRS